MDGYELPPFFAWNTIHAGPIYTKEILGGKGHGLFEMTEAEVPVPEFVVIPTTLCVEYMQKPAETRMKVKGLVPEIIKAFEEYFGYLPLLSVRSGARVSMPGMMDTILNVGIGDDKTAPYTGKLSGRTYADCYRRFLHMFGSTVRGIPDSAFEAVMTAARAEAGVATDAELTAEQMLAVADRFEDLYAENQSPEPGSARDQIEACILAVMDSWNSERAVEYRKHNAIPDDWGTAVVIQRMVFGNMNENSGSGVLFSRDPATGANELTGEYLINAQGEDVVAGIRTPLPLSEMKPESLLTKLATTVVDLETVHHDMLDIEFTVEDGKLYFLQIRTAKRSARAHVRCALDMVGEGLIEPHEAFKRIKREHVRTLTQPVVDPSFTQAADLTGIPACAGVVTGAAAFTPAQAIAYKEAGTPCILIRHETSPDDIAGMFAAVGVLTATGGSTSHAAVVARGMDKVCVTGAGGLAVTSDSARVEVDGVTHEIMMGDKVTVCGTTGRVWFHCDVPVSDPLNDPDLADLIKFVDGDTSHTDLALPGSPGSVYALSQFLADVPAPTTKEVMVLEDAHTFEDPLLCLTDGFGAYEAAARLASWAVEHGIKPTLYTKSGFPAEIVNTITVKDVAPGLKGLMERPVTRETVAAHFGGDVSDIELLIAPAKLEDKFKLIGCQRHRLLSAFA